MNHRLVTGIAIVAGTLGSGASPAAAQTGAGERMPQAAASPAPLEAGIGDINAPLNPLEDAVALAIAAGLAARGVRGFRIRQEYATAEEGLAEVGGSFDASLTAATQHLEGLPEDEPHAHELKDLSTRLADEAGRLDGRQKTFKNRYKIQAQSLWPSKDRVGKLVSDIDVETAVAKRVSENAAGTIQNFEARSQTAAQEVAGFGATVDGLHIAADELRDSGWDLGDAGDLLSGLDTISSHANNLLSEKRIEETIQHVESSSESAEDMRQLISGLPERREAADAEVDQQPTTIAAAKEVVANTKTRLDAMRDACDPSCYEDFESLGDDLDTKLADLESRHYAARAVTGVKSFAAIKETESLAEQFQAIREEIAEASASLREREDLIEKIRTELPEVIDGLNSQLAGVRQYAFEEYAGDVEDTTREAIEELEANLKGFKEQEVAAERPAYLKINSAAERYNAAIDDLKSRAEAERAEMKMFRTMAPVRLEDVEHVRGRLNELARQHGRPVTDAVGHLLNVAIPELDMNLDRAGLRGQYERADALADRMWDAYSGAHDAIRAAEEQRRKEQFERGRRMAEREAFAHAKVWGVEWKLFDF